MIDSFSLALTHGLLLLVAWRLLSRPDLPLEQQVHAQYELGMDYLKAGLLDRAEETFNLLVDTTYAVQARRALLEIFQREKEWRRAIAAAEGLQESGAGAQHKDIAQFYCELAQDAMVHLQPADAMGLLEKALQSDRKSVRATMRYPGAGPKSRADNIRDFIVYSKQELAGFGESGGLFSQQASPGFIELWSLQSRMAYAVRNRGKEGT